MSDTARPEFAAPRYESRHATLLAGLKDTYPYGKPDDIPLLWQKFNAYFGKIPHQVPDLAFGVCIDAENNPGHFHYIAAAEVTDASGVPSELMTLTLPAQRYAVFEVSGHVSRIAPAVEQIFTRWLPRSGHQHAGMPGMFELYDDARFDPQTASGIIELWIPIK